ncbi:MAG: Asp-tRNA(Asn)/Glu-tRNA(Gln) amidotransferase subunit GatC [Candidatus Paceibacterota bacterium]
MTNEDIQKLGELAKIEINPEEAEGFKKDFESILGYINQIESVDVSDVKETFLQKMLHKKILLETKQESFLKIYFRLRQTLKTDLLKLRKFCNMIDLKKSHN